MSPLTLDHDWLLQKPRPAAAGHDQGRTAIGSALSASINRLRGQKAEIEAGGVAHRWTEQRGGESIRPLAAQARAGARGQVYTIGSAPREKRPCRSPTTTVVRRIVMTKVTWMKGCSRPSRTSHGWALLSRHRRRIGCSGSNGAIDTLGERPRGTEKYEHHGAVRLVRVSEECSSGGEIGLGLTRVQEDP